VATDLVRRGGSSSMIVDGCAKAAQGLTSLREVMASVGA